MSLPGIQFAEAGSIDPGNKEFVRLRNGEILLETVDPDKPGGAAKVTALFHAEPESIWRVIGYCEYAYVYIRGLKFCEMLEGDEFNMTMHHRLRSSWYAPTLDFVFRAQRVPGGHGDAQLVSGNLKLMEAYWRLTPLGNDEGVLVVHQLRIQPNIPTPRWLIHRGLKKDLPDMLACIRGLAQASAKTELVFKDLDRCQGKVPASVK